MASLAYRVHQSIWTAWARRHYRSAFDDVRAFCLFVGYPRSGHSLVGALLNAHRNIVISHELDVPPLILAGCSRDTLYARILAHAAWFNLRGNTSNYVYQVPNQWQGRFETLRVMGDKRGGFAALTLGRHPDLLERIRIITGVPLRVIHVVRHPFDNIAAISRWHRLTIDESIEYYFRLCRITARLGNYADAREIRTVHHEEMIRSPRSTLDSLCLFLGVDSEPSHLTDSVSIVAKSPALSRLRVRWSDAQIASVTSRAAEYPFLQPYSFEPIEGDAAPSDEPRAEHSPSLCPRIVQRFFPNERASTETDAR